MATPIKETPVVRGKSAERILKVIDTNNKEKTVAQPKSHSSYASAILKKAKIR